MKLLLQPFSIVFLVLHSNAWRFWPTVVRQGTVKLLERFGEYKKTLKPGLHWVVPIAEVCREVPMKEIVLDTPPQNCITLDNAPVQVDAVMYYRIVDPVLARYNVSDLFVAMSNLVKTQVRSEIGKLELDATFSARQALGANLLASMKEGVDAWGVQVTRVEIKEIAPNRDILHSMEQVMAAERQKRALVLKSEGERLAKLNSAAAQADAAVQAAQAAKQVTVLTAEAAATSRALAAEAEANAIRIVSAAQADASRLTAEGTKYGLEKIAAALGNPELALRYEALRQYMEANTLISNSPNTKTLVLPRGDEWLTRVGLTFSEATKMDSIISKQ